MDLALILPSAPYVRKVIYKMSRTCWTTLPVYQKC